MKKFDFLRYIRQWRYVIVIFCIVGILATNYYSNSAQSYTASAVIEYSNADASSKGITRYGAKILPSEITSSYVIADVIEQLDLNTSVDSLRSHITVKGIADPDEEAKKTALLDKGEDYTYYKTKYQISYSCDSSYSKEYAKNVVNQVIRSYISFYGEKYLNNVIAGIALKDIKLSNHDFLDCAALVDYSVSTMLSYVENRQSVDNTFRSSKTGYSFSDFTESLTYLQDYAVPKLYATVLDNGLTLDRVALLARLKNEISVGKVDSANLKDNIKKVSSLMTKYEKKYQNSQYWSTTNSSSSSSSTSSSYYSDGSTPVIINNVEQDNDKARANSTTTYDTLIQNYVNLIIQYDNSVLNRDYDTDSYEIFKGVKHNTSISSAQAEKFSSVLTSTTDEISDLYNILADTITEYNQYVGATDLSILSTTTAAASLNQSMYMTIAVLLFGIIGICGAILAGRFGDFINYFLYIDRRAGIANRVRCDIEIGKYEKKLLPNSMCCMMFRIDKLSKLNKRSFGAGNAQLKAFAKILKTNAEHFGFVGYNNGTSFMALFEDCPQARAAQFCKQVILDIIDYNIKNEASPIEFSVGVAVSDKDNIFDIHKLISAAFGKIDNNSCIVAAFEQKHPNLVAQKKAEAERDAVREALEMEKNQESKKRIRKSPFSKSAGEAKA